MENTTKIRVLLVDDEIDFLNSLSRALERRSFDVTTAPNGHVALDLIGENKFDVVVLDLKMPGLSGERVFQEIKHVRPGLPVIMLTGHGTIQSAFQTSKDGVFDYLSKPCDVDDIVPLLNRAASERRNFESELEETGSSSLRVLLVDDEIDLLQSMTRALERRGMKVSTAPDGERAVAQAKQKVFDVVVVDVKMPGQGGIETLRQLKEVHPLLEVIVLTGHPTSPQAVEAVNAGAFGFLTKPIDAEALAEQIRAAGKRRTERVEEERQERMRELSRRVPS